MANTDLGQRLFHPRAVALVGASSDGRKNSGRPQRYLQKHGFGGSVFPVNPAREIVQGKQAYASILDIPGPVDHAFIMVPAVAIPKVIKDCCAKGVGVATIYSDGFAETGPDGQALQDDIIAIARKGGLRLLGPNSMGLINTHTALTLSVNAVLELDTLPSGTIGLISQSGTILGTLISRGAARGIGFSKLISLGNESDLSVGELCDLLVDDPKTKSIVLFLEGLRNAEELAAAARRAFDAGKPVIAYKLGRSDAGRALAVSHSGAIAGTDRCVQAFFDHHGIIRVNMLENLFECPALLAAKKPVGGKRVSVVTTTGGGAALVADRLGELGLDLAPPSDGLRKRLSKLGLNIGDGPLIDLTMAGTREGVYGEALDEVLSNDDCDAVVAVVGSSGQFHPELAVAPIVNTDARGKFLAAFIAPEANQSLASLAAAGIAAFRTPEACADAVSAALNWKAPTVVTSAGEKMTDVEKHLAGRHHLNESDAATVFAALGIPQASSAIITDPENDTVPNLSYPVAVKVLSENIAHKTDVGGVILSVPDETALRQACRDIQASVETQVPDAEIQGYLVQNMESGMCNVLIGFRRDPEVGPVVVLGTGGILAELYDDVAIRPAPIDKPIAHDMINAVRGLAPLCGYRSQQKGDIDALADALVALSQLARVSTIRIHEAEINPLIVKAEGQGIVAVDGLIVCG